MNIKEELKEYIERDEVKYYNGMYITYSQVVAEELISKGFDIRIHVIECLEKVYDLNGEIVDKKPVDVAEPTLFYEILDK